MVKVCNFHENWHVAPNFVIFNEIGYYMPIFKKITYFHHFNISIQKNIKAMYENTAYKIKLKNGSLDPISSNLGLKQGCPLRPMLFNICIDDINDIFDQDCDPVDIQNEDLYHFLLLSSLSSKVLCVMNILLSP